MKPAFWLRSLSARMVMVNAALTMGFAALMILLLTWLAARFMSHHVDDAVMDELQMLQSEYRIDGMRGMQGLIQQRLLANPDNHQVYLLLDAGGSKLAGNLDRWPALQPDREGRSTIPSISPGPIVPVRVRSAQLIDGSQLLVGYDEHEIDYVLVALEQAAAIGLVVTLLLGGLTGVITSRLTLRHIEAITRTAGHIIEGDLSQRVPLRGSQDEFDELGSTLNEMLDRINELMSAVKYATESLAHDLRSPLARMRNRIESAKGVEMGPEAQREFLDTLASEVDRVLTVFASLLRLATIESGVLRGRFKPLALAELVTDAVSLYEALASERDIEVVLDPVPNVVIEGDRDLLFQAVCNLLDNAVKFAPDGGKVGVRVSIEGEQLRIAISDNGPGVPAEERERVFERLVRLDASRSSPGYGLGLSLVRGIAELHHGSARLVEGQTGGTCAVLEIPLRG